MILLLDGALTLTTLVNATTTGAARRARRAKNCILSTIVRNIREMKDLLMK